MHNILLLSCLSATLLHATQEKCKVLTKSTFTLENQEGIDIDIKTKDINKQYVGSVHTPLVVETYEDMPESGTLTHQFYAYKPDSDEQYIITHQIEIQNCAIQSFRQFAPPEITATSKIYQNNITCTYDLTLLKFSEQYE